MCVMQLFRSLRPLPWNLTPHSMAQAAALTPQEVDRGVLKHSLARAVHTFFVCLFSLVYSIHFIHAARRHVPGECWHQRCYEPDARGRCFNSVFFLPRLYPHGLPASKCRW